MESNEINNYRIIELVEQGSFGIIYLVYGITDNKKYALKESIIERCQSFTREISALITFRSKFNVIHRFLFFNLKLLIE